MLFEKTRKRKALDAVIKVVESSSIVRDAIYTVEARYPKGAAPAEDIKPVEALRLIMRRLRQMGLTIYADDAELAGYLNDKIRAAHADASMDKNSKYNEPETEPVNVYSAGSITYR